MAVGPNHTLVDAVASIEDVSSRIEDAFASVGHQLGRGHIIFKELNQSLAALSVEISGTELEGAANALQEIAARLNELAQVLPAEGALLETIRNHTVEASSLLKPLFKHIQMITIIARSAKIEAASLERDREGFLSFTEEAHGIGMAVQRLIEGCGSDQQRLSEAVATASGRQKEFAARYRDQLISGGAELASAYSVLREQRGQSTQLAELAGASTRKVAEAVGSAIVSLQAGDGARQRLEHVCHGLRVTTGAGHRLAPDAATEPADIDGRRAISQLQAAQLEAVEREFGGDIGNIVRSLSDVLRDSRGIVSQGCSLFAGGDGTSSSRLARIEETLAQASALIASCETASRSVDDALTIVEDTLAKFREAISRLAEAVVDITLIGMNASLKAGHLGAKGSAFVVIANELKTTADQVSAGASRLRPVLDNIEQSARELKTLRVHGDRTQLARLEPQVLQALREVEAGNDRLGKLINRLVSDGAEFEGLMDSAQTEIAGVRQSSANLAVVATRLAAAAGTPQKLRLAPADQAALDELFACYTMEREREVHREFLQQAGVVSAVAMQPAQSADVDDGVLLF